MATLNRRATRSMNREVTPAPVTTGANVPAARTRAAVQPRPEIPALQSFAYGSPGRAGIPRALNVNYINRPAAQAIQARINESLHRTNGTSSSSSLKTESSRTVTGLISGSRHDELEPITEDSTAFNGDVDTPRSNHSANDSFAIERTLGGQAGISMGLPTPENSSEESINGAQTRIRQVRFGGQTNARMPSRTPTPSLATETSVEGQSQESARVGRRPSPAEWEVTSPYEGFPPTERDSSLFQRTRTTFHDHQSAMSQIYKWMLLLPFLILAFKIHYDGLPITFGTLDSFITRNSKPTFHNTTNPAHVVFEPTTNTHAAYNILPREFINLLNRVTNLEIQQSSLSKSLKHPAPTPPSGSKLQSTYVGTNVRSHSNGINYFNPGLGALIDPYLTSPTYTRVPPPSLPAKLLAYPLKVLAFLNPLPTRRVIYPPPPIMALMPWDGPGDCWCAAPAQGKAQLAVMMPKKVVPQVLVVEHVHGNEVEDLGDAPRELELWVLVEESERREVLGDALVEEPGEGVEKGFAERALDERWVRIGRWRYEVGGAEENVQRFEVGIDLKRFDVGVRKAVVRVRNRWGEGVGPVCLYRVKMFGVPFEVTS